MEEEILKKWDSLFVLTQTDGISREMAIEMSLKMEIMANYLLNDNNSNQSIIPDSRDTVESVVFPVIYRIIKHGGEICEPKTLIRCMVGFFNQHKDRIDNAWSTHYNGPMDLEAELCALFCEHYIENGCDPIIPLKYFKKWVK